MESVYGMGIDGMVEVGWLALYELLLSAFKLCQNWSHLEFSLYLAYNCL